MNDIHFEAIYQWLCVEISAMPINTKEDMCRCTASLRDNIITVGFPDGEKEVYPLTDEEYFYIERLASEGSMDKTLF